MRPFQGYDKFLGMFRTPEEVWEVVKTLHGCDGPWVEPDRQTVVELVVSGRFFSREMDTWVQMATMIYLAFNQNARTTIVNRAGGRMSDLNDIMLPFLQQIMEYEEKRRQEIAASVG